MYSTNIILNSCPIQFKCTVVCFLICTIYLNKWLFFISNACVLHVLTKEHKYIHQRQETDIRSTPIPYNPSPFLPDKTELTWGWSCPPPHDPPVGSLDHPSWSWAFTHKSWFHLEEIKSPNQTKGQIALSKVRNINIIWL